MLLIVKVLLFDAYPEWRFLAAVLGSTPESGEPQEEAAPRVEGDSG